MHDSYDNPPLITDGNTKKTANQSTPTGAVVTAANAIASALKLPEAQSQSQQNSDPKSKKNQVSSAAISPCTRASLHKTLCEALASIQKLYEDYVLSPSEFNEQKKMLLKELQPTMPTQPGSSENS